MKQHRRFLIGLVAVVLAITVLLSSTGIANAAISFHSGFETGNGGEWTSVTGSPTIVNSSTEILWSPFLATDPDSKWSNESSAYDSDTATSAHLAEAGYYLILWTNTNRIDRVKVYSTNTAERSIDIYVDGGWVNIYTGTAASGWNTYTFDPIVTYQARITWTSSTSFLLGEFVFGLANHPIKTGTYAMRCSTSAATAYVDNGIADGSMDRGSFYLYIAAAPSADVRIIGNGTGAALYLTTTREVDYYTAATKRSDGATQITLYTWTRVSWATDGVTFKTFINGAQDISNAVTLDEVADGTIGVCTAVTTNLYFDDCVFDNTSSTTDLGDIRTLVAIPNAAGTYSEFDTNNYASVDEIPYSDADYNVETSRDTVYRVTYNLQSCATAGLGASDTINAVTFRARMYGDNVDPTAGWTVRDNATNYETLFLMTDDAPNFYWYYKLYATNAPRGTAWSQAIFDAIEAGMYHGGDSDDSAISVLYAMIAYTPVAFDISNSPSSKAFGVVAASSTYYAKGTAPSNPVVDGNCTFTITNNAAAAVKINIHGHAFTGGVGWTLTSGAPGSDTVRITTYYSGQDPASGVVLTTSDQTFIASLAGSSTKMWDFKFETGTFTDGTQKTGIITLVAATP